MAGYKENIFSLPINQGFNVYAQRKRKCYFAFGKENNLAQIMQKNYGRIQIFELIDQCSVTQHTSNLAYKIVKNT